MTCSGETADPSFGAERYATSGAFSTMSRKKYIEVDGPFTSVYRIATSE